MSTRPGERLASRFQVFRNLILNGAQLLGEAFDPIDDTWMPFTIDLRGRIVTGGSWQGTTSPPSSLWFTQLLREKPVRTLAGVIAIIVLSVPVGIILTIALLPLWRWIEERIGIESVGHSGPAEWCYVATFLVSCISLLLCSRRLKNNPRSG